MNTTTISFLLPSSAKDGRLISIWDCLDNLPFAKRLGQHVWSQSLVPKSILGKKLEH